MVDQWLAGAVIGYDGNGDYIYILYKKRGNSGERN
jgi:hypothetical protein